MISRSPVETDLHFFKDDKPQDSKDVWAVICSQGFLVAVAAKWPPSSDGYSYNEGSGHSLYH